MKQRRFEEQHTPFWDTVAARLQALERRRGGPPDPADAEFPTTFRRLCRQLATARERCYSSRLDDRLNRLVLRAYQQFYRTLPGRADALLAFITAGFPRLVRREAILFGVCALLFYLPLFGMGWSVYAAPELVYSLLNHEQVAELEAMYRPESHAAGRGADSDVLMLGYYIANNIGIAFRTFAAGIVAGIGTVFILLMNGVYIGAVAGYLTAQGHGGTFYPFVAGHSAFELTGIVLAGVAGLKLGLALLAPGRLSRPAALRRAAAISVRLLYGVAGLLLLAAAIEAFWSSSHHLPAAVRYGCGGAGWLLLTVYLLGAGR